VVASGNEVGKISIRVVPNLEDFHEDLERQLKAEEKKRHKVKIGVDTDTSSIPRDVKKAQKSVGDIEVDVVGDTKMLTDDIKAALGDEKALVKVDADIREAEEKTRRLAKQLSDATQVRVDFTNLIKQQDAFVNSSKSYAEVKTRLNFDRLLAEQAKLKAALEKDVIGVPVEPEVKSGWRARLESLVRAQTLRVPVKFDVDDKSLRGVVAIDRGFDRAMSAAGKAAEGALSGIEGIAKGAAKAGLAVLRMGDAFWILVAVIAVAAPALALLAGTLVALPGLLTAFAVPIAAVALGMDGIKEAAKAAQPAFDKLKATMSETFQNGMTPGFQLLADKLFPRLQSELPKVAESLSGLFDVFTNTLTTDGNLGKIEGTIRGIATALSQAAPGVASFTNAFTTLINSTAGPLLSSLSNTINQLGGEFEAWVGKVTANGQLQAAMDTLKGTLGEIGGILKDITSYSFDALSDPAFGQSMKGFVQDVRALVNDILPLLKSGFQDVAQIISGIRDTVDAIKSAGNWIEKITGGGSPIEGPKQTEGFMGLFGKDGLLGDNAPIRNSDWAGGFFKDLFPPNEANLRGQEAGQQFQEGFTESATPQGGGGQVFTDFVETAKNQLTTGLGSTAGVPFDAAGIADGIRNQLSGQIQAAITEAQASIQELGPTLQASIDGAVAPLESLPTKISGVFDTLVPAITGSFDTIKTTVTAGITEMTTGIGDAFNLLPQSASTAFQGIQDTITGAFGFMVLAIGQQAENINTAVGQAFTKIPATITTSLSGVVQSVVGAFSGIKDKISSALSGVPGAITNSMRAGEAATNGMNQAVSAIQMSGGAVTAATISAFSGVSGAIEGQMSGAVGIVSDSMARIVSGIMSFGGAMESAGRSVGASFAAGLASSESLVAAAASSLMAAARKMIPSSPAKEGPFSGRGWVTYSGESVGEGFAKGMENSTSGVVSTARELMQAVKDIFGSAEGLTLNFNLGGVTEQAEAATKQVQVFGDTLSKVPTGPLNDLAVASGTEMSSADSEAKRDELSQQLDLLEMERKSLELEKGRAGANNDAIKARLAEIKEQKLQLGLQKDQLDYAKKYGAETEQTGGKVDQFYRDMGEKIFKMPTDFARAIGAQFTQDLGISGQGAIPQLLEQGSQFIFQVANMDTALSAQQTLQRRQGMGLVGR
jgi:hypothetical protein